MKQQNTTTSTVKNPYLLEANQLAFYKCSWEVEPGITGIKFNEWSERVLNPGSPDLKASALTTGPHFLRNVLCCSTAFSSNCVVPSHLGGRRGGLMVRALDSGLSGPGSGPGWGHCVVF